MSRTEPAQEVDLSEQNAITTSTHGYDPSPTYEGMGGVQWTYAQSTPSIVDPVKWYTSNFKQRVINYFVSMFPIATWIHRYNFKWLYGDLIAGLTVGIVVVPQGMSYAKVAGLPVQYGLYSSFMGVMLYCFFATSKDVSIGPVAVMSAETYKVTHRVLKNVPGLTEKDLPAIAGVLSLLCGAVTLGMGILRLGFLLEYIPMPAVMGFMTGSAFTIAVGQIPSLMGIDKLLDTRAASYKVVINTLKQLHHSDVNAAFGLVSLLVLYVLKYLCGYLEKRDKRRKWVWFYLNTMRSALVVIFSTLISWGCYRIYGKTKISMIGTVPRGLTDVGIHPVDRKVASALASELPISVVILVLEHIAISKSFGRINEYRVNPDQELIAIGVANMIGHFFQAYPNTGSFSRTALKSKCGVRTPLAGIFTGVCVLVASYALTDAFYFISKAALAAIIIHAVGDLIASFQTTYKFFQVSPVEFLIFIIDVFLCVFTTLEVGLYFSFGASMVYLLLKQTFPMGEFLGRVEYISPLANPPIVDEPKSDMPKFAATSISAVKKYSNKISSKLSRNKKETENAFNEEQAKDEFDTSFKEKKVEPHIQSLHSSSSQNNSINANSANDGFRAGEIFEHLDDTIMPSGPGEPDDDRYTRPVVTNPGQVTTKWWPLSNRNVNPEIRIVPPPPGIYVYRFRESLTYQNASWQSDRLVEYMRANTRRNLDISHYQNMRLGDRPWNEPGPRKYKPPAEEDTRPVLRAIVFDMSSSPNVDMTGAQILWDTHQELTKYACVPVEFHFAGIMSPWSRRALLETGFGKVSSGHTPQTERPVELARTKREDSESTTAVSSYAPVMDTNTCFFHFDIPELELRE